MQTKHTTIGNDLESALSSMLEEGGESAASLVLNHLELSRRAIEWLMQRETADLAGDRYSHDKPHGGRFSRWGSNPGSVAVGGQKLRVDVPRIRDNESRTTRSPEIYSHLQQIAEPPLHIMRALMLGLGTRKYRETAEMLLDSIGMSKSSLSEKFVEHSQEILEEFLQRRLDDATYVAMYVDGKVLQSQSMVVAIGITDQGVKRTLGLTQATTENSAVIAVMFRDMIARGLDVDHGLLVVIDGGTGLRKAIDEVFGAYAVVQRCQIHKKRNVLSHLSESDRSTWDRKLSVLFNCEDHTESSSMADGLCAELQRININAARSLAEGLEDMMTITRLGLHAVFGRCFRTTNIIESVNSSVARYTRHITRWRSADQRMRWTALALMEVEPSWNKIQNYRRLPMLQRALQIEVNKRLLTLESDTKPKRISTRKRT